MKKIIKWLSISIAALLVLAAAFTAVFVVIPLSKSVKNLQEKKEGTSVSVSQTAPTEAPTEAPATDASAPQTAPAETTAPAEESLPAEADAPQETVFTEYDIYRSGKFYVKGTVMTDDGEVNPMEMAITDGSVYMLTSASGVKMGVMIGGGKTYLVSPEHRAYIELSKSVMSMLGMDPAKLTVPSSFNFSDMPPLTEAESVNDTTLNGAACQEYVFRSASGKKVCVYMSGTRLLQTDMYNTDGALYNRMTFDSVSAEIPDDRKAPPTYYEKKGLLGFIAMMGKDVSSY